jgi:hypothetical protein
MVTGCGRRVTVGRFRIPSAPTIERLVLRIGPGGSHDETVWASLTPDEALVLSHVLAAEARAAAGRDVA